eukprot:3086332-Rhodomonas_salina.1
MLVEGGGRGRRGGGRAPLLLSLPREEEREEREAERRGEWGAAKRVRASPAVRARERASTVEAAVTRKSPAGTAVVSGPEVSACDGDAPQVPRRALLRGDGALSQR